MKKENKQKCVEQKKGKYVSEKRKAPPFPANECCGQTKKGKDGQMYISRTNKNGVCGWYKVRPTLGQILGYKKKKSPKKRIDEKNKQNKQKKVSCNNRNPSPPCKEGYSPKLNKKKNIECCYKSKKKDNQKDKKKKSPKKRIDEKNKQNKQNKQKKASCNNRNPSPPCKEGYSPKLNKKKNIECCYKSKKNNKAKLPKIDNKKNNAVKEKVEKAKEKKNNKVTKFTDYVNKEKIASKVKLELNIPKLKGNTKPKSEKIKDYFKKKGFNLSDEKIKELMTTRTGKKIINEILNEKVFTCENSSKVDWKINIENDLNKLKIKNNDVFYGNKKLTKGKTIGKGAYGTVDIYTLDDKPMFAVKNVTSGDPDDEEEIDNEIKILLKLERKNIKCNIMGAKILYENKNDLIKLVELEDKKKPAGLNELRWHVMQKIEKKKFKQSKKIPKKIKVAMSLYDGDLGKLSGKLSNSTILKIGMELAKINKCLINSGLFYTDFKPQNVLWKCNSKNSIYIRLADIGGIFTKEDDFAAQTYPYPTANYDSRDTDTFALASEKVVVWGLGMLMLLMLPNYDYDSQVSSLVYWGSLSDANLKKFRQKLDNDKSVPQVIKDTLGANKNFKIKIKTINQIIKSLNSSIKK